MIKMVERSADALEKLLDGLSIQPPKLEDAGLEDCALPPHSIMEAFSRAAAARYEYDDDEDNGDVANGGCIQGPGSTIIGGSVTAAREDEEEDVIVGGDGKGDQKPIIDGGEGDGVDDDDKPSSVPVS